MIRTGIHSNSKMVKSKRSLGRNQKPTIGFGLGSAIEVRIRSEIKNKTEYGTMNGIKFSIKTWKVSGMSQETGTIFLKYQLAPE